MAPIALNNGLIKESSAQPQTRTVTFKIYSFFDVPIDPDVWRMRWETYGEDYLLSSTYPVVYLWETSPGNIWYYSSARINVQARNIPEATIDKPVFLPYNLMGGLEPGVVGGTAQIVDWYLFFPNSTRLKALKFPTAWWDGYVTELTGKIVLDKNGARKILGITEAQFNNFATWWATNEKNVETAWSGWLTSLGGQGGAFDIRPMYDWPYTDFPGKYTFYLDLESATATSITLKVDILSMGMECMLARMFRATVLPMEPYFDDLHFNAVIRADSADLDLDAVWQWALYMWCLNNTAWADPTWAIEPVLGDYPDLAVKYNVPNSPAYPYYGKTYYVVGPGNYWYDGYIEYDYTPASFNLKEGETLIIDWSNTDKGPVWVFKQNPWTPPQKPNDTLTVVTGWLEFSDTSEPYPKWIPNHPQMSYNPTAKTLTFTGPLNFTQFSQQFIPEEWERIGGLLPTGEPWIEFKVVPYEYEHDVAVVSVEPYKKVVCTGYSTNINVTVVNQGSVPETFDVKLYANTTMIGTKTISLENGTSTTLTFTWNTTGYAKGNYTIKAEAGPVQGETEIGDNTLVDGWVFVTIVGDVNADRKVDLKDIFAIALAYGASPGHPKWNPNLDINNDKKIDLKDYFAAAKQYGATW
ncbi:MAG: CARDB domain-containing protein [Candidatus Bathyarchaeia archaeon]